MIITNFKSLAKNSLPDRRAGLREKALLIAEAGYEAIDIEKTVKSRISAKNNILEIRHFKKEDPYKIDLGDFKRVFIVGIGKGSALASASLVKILGGKLTGGIALDINKPKINSKLQTTNYKLQTFIGTHPLPSAQNIKATKEIIKLAKSLKKEDLLITFICGGGSALSCGSETELKNSILVTKELTKAGANITELNTVRKHLSEFKGGGLAKMAYPATIVSLIVSDVCGNELSSVASGPTVYDKTTKKDAESILKKYNLQLLINNLKLLETPKDDKYFKAAANILFVCNQDAIDGMMKKAEELGFVVKIHSLALEGEAKNIFLPIIKKIKPREAIIAAGETTVTLNKYQVSGIKYQDLGKGGRNQEAVLGAISNLQSTISNDLVVISFASDAHDNTEAAGAIDDYLVLKKIEKLKLNPQDFLNRHDSFNFFKKTGNLIYAKQKCFNVADLMLVLNLPKE